MPDQATRQNERALVELEFLLDNSVKRFKTIYKKAVAYLGEALVDRTPVYFPGANPEAGRARGNWNFTEDTPDFSYMKERTDPEGTESKSALRSVLSKMKVTDGTITYLANGSPHFKYFEFGLYPDPVKLGSPVPGNKGAYEIRSEGGFSKMAPGGVIGIVEMQWPSFLTRAGIETRSMNLGRNVSENDA